MCILKKSTILNAPLSHAIATLGHTDGLCICDAGLPIANESSRIDLALSAGIPDFLSTLSVVLSELFVERIVLAEEIKAANPQIEKRLLALMEEISHQQNKQISIDYVPHETFKRLTHECKAVVRTGECSPYANVILYSGVPF